MSLKRSRCEGVGAAAAPCGPLLHHSRRSSRKRPRKTEPEASHKRQASSTGRGARAAAAAEVAPSVPNTGPERSAPGGVPVDPGRVCSVLPLPFSAQGD